MTHPDLNRALRWLPLALACCVLGAVILYAPGRALTPLPEASSPLVSDPEPTRATQALGELAAWPLFGVGDSSDQDASRSSTEAGGPAGRVPDESVVLPATALDVQVRGLAYATSAARAHAILQVNGQAQQRYRPGDVLTDGVTLAAVRPMEVVIANQGRMESAALPVAPADLAAPVVSMLPATSPAPAPDVGAPLEESFP